MCCDMSVMLNVEDEQGESSDAECESVLIVFLSYSLSVYF